MNPQRWAILGVQFGYPATRQIGAHHGASAEVAEQLQTVYREMANKLNAVSLSNGNIFSRGLAHPLAHLPPERLQQILAQHRREGGQEGLIGVAGGPHGLVGPPSVSQPGMPPQPSQQQPQSRMSMPGLPGQQPGQLQQPGVAGGAMNPAMGPGPGQYLAVQSQANPAAPARMPPGMSQPAVNANAGPVPTTQPDLSRPPNFEAPEAAVVLKMQEMATEIFRSQMTQNMNASE